MIQRYKKENQWLKLQNDNTMVNLASLQNEYDQIRIDRMNEWIPSGTEIRAEMDEVMKKYDTHTVLRQEIEDLRYENKRLSREANRLVAIEKEYE